MKQLFITGATGCIGGRLAEVAVARSIPVAGLVRSWPRAARLARLPVKMLHGDVMDAASLREAMKDSDVVVHCAIDYRVSGRRHRRSTAQGTTNVLEAASALGVKRVVHLSSVAVYGYKPGPDNATEDGPYRYSRDAYCDGKIDAEKAVLRYHRSRALPVVVLRPAIVYGPFSLWTVATATALRERRAVLVNGGAGICNAIFIDNLVDAILLAAENDNAVGDVFHVSDDAPITWKTFIEAHARALCDRFQLPAMTLDEIAAAQAGLKKTSPSSLQQVVHLARDPRTLAALRSIPVADRWVRAASALVNVFCSPERRRALLAGYFIRSNNRERVCPSANGPEFPSASELDVYTTNVVFNDAKIRKRLGYAARRSFADAMARTSDWIRWSRL